MARIRATLPNDPLLQEPQIIKADPNATPVLTVYVSDPSRTSRDLSDIIVNQLSDELASVQGVGSVGKIVPAAELIARFKQEYDTAVDPPL